MNKVEELVKRGVKKLAIVAPAFLADGLETLEELDIGIREHFIELGGEELTVIKCLNDNEDWVEGLSKLVVKNSTVWLLLRIIQQTFPLHQQRELLIPR